MNSGVPTYDQLFNPLLTSMQQLGGSATIQEIEQQVADTLQLTEDQINDIHKGNTTKLSYRLAWTRNYLKRYGLLENSSRGVWSLTKQGFETKSVDEEKVKQTVRSLDKTETYIDETNTLEEDTKFEDTWKGTLIDKLQHMDPTAFERLCQRVLRESGFVEVEVTGRSGDGGIDGHGIIKLNHLIDYPILFQCKRYKGSVPSKEIRDFRGAMAGRTDKGIFLTTGNFTRDAKNEARRDGVSTINLIDGDALAELMKELKLGVNIELVEQIELNEKWFEDFE